MSGLPDLFENLAADDVEVIRVAETEIRAHQRRAFGEVVAIGRELTRVKAILPHGTFERWIESNFDFAVTSARNYMRLAAVPELEPATVAGLPLAIVYQIASPDLTAEHRAEILAPDDGRHPVEWKVKSRLAHVRRTIKSERANEVAEAKLTLRARAKRKAAAKRREAASIDWRTKLAREQEQRDAATGRLVAMLLDQLTPEQLSEVRELLPLVYAVEVVSRIETLARTGL